jgi:hypothetical protein
MQVYAAALVHTAFRVAQGHIAQAIGTKPEEISPAKFFPRMAAASIGLTWSELVFIEIQLANPGTHLHKPDWRRCDFAWTTFERIRVEHSTGDDESDASVRAVNNGNPSPISQVEKN